MLQVNTFEQTEEYRKGFDTESTLAQILRDDGYFVVITADVKERGKNGAPGARSKEKFITLPDLDVAKNGHRGFVEVKYKYEADFTTVTNRLEHGIGLNQFKKSEQRRATFHS
jgi:hypothetical protein